MIYRPEISACDHCGLCCRSPCLLGGWDDVQRIAAFLGVSEHDLLGRLMFEKTKTGEFRVRPKPAGDRCQFHVNGRCAIHEVKPKGGREFECWTPSTQRQTYGWSRADIEKIGVPDIVAWGTG